MPNQTFAINTKSAYAGDIYGITITNSQRNTYLANTGDVIEYGFAVKAVGDRRADVGVNADGTIAGVVMRSLNNEQAYRPGDGTVFFRKDDAMTVLEEGFIVVKATGATAGGPAYITPEGGFSAVATGNTLAVNARFYRDSDEFGMAVVYVEHYLGKPSA